LKDQCERAGSDAPPVSAHELANFPGSALHMFRKDAAPFAELSVREDLRLGAFSRRWDGETRGDLGRVLERFPALAERIDQTAGTLSGGDVHAQ
jgi:branched-chain amino acid transport system ATP-binding protein